MKLILLPILLFCSLSASAQKAKQDSTPVVINTMDLVTQEIRINPKDTAMMHEKDLILSPIFLTLDPSAKIYTKEERDSIVAKVLYYKKALMKN
jgi:hypothetical protein